MMTKEKERSRSRSPIQFRDSIEESQTNTETENPELVTTDDNMKMTEEYYYDYYPDFDAPGKSMNDIDANNEQRKNENDEEIDETDQDQGENENAVEKVKNANDKESCNEKNGNGKGVENDEDKSENKNYDYVTKELSSKESISHNRTADCYNIYVRGLPKVWSYLTIKRFIFTAASLDHRKEHKMLVVKLRSELDTAEILLKFHSPRTRMAVFEKLSKITNCQGSELRVTLVKGNTYANRYIHDEQSKICERKFMTDLQDDDKEIGETSERANVVPTPSSAAYHPNPNPPIKGGLALPEKMNMDTYGLSPAFLASLRIKPPLHTTITVSKLHPNVTAEKLRNIFSLAGRVVRVDEASRKGKCHARIEYDHPLEAVQAVSMFHGRRLYDIPMIVIMYPCPTRKPLPEGLMSIGNGLGPSGVPIKGVRAHLEIRAMKNELMRAISELSKKITQGNTMMEPTRNPNQQPNQNLLANALSSLSEPNTLMAMNALVNVQSMFQQNAGMMDMTNIMAMLQCQSIPNMQQPGMQQNSSNVFQPGNNAQTPKISYYNQTDTNYNQNVTQQISRSDNVFQQQQAFNNPTGFTPPFPGPLNPNTPYNQTVPTPSYNQTDPTPSYNRSAPSTYVPNPAGSDVKEWKVHEPATPLSYTSEPKSYKKAVERQSSNSKYVNRSLTSITDSLNKLASVSKTPDVLVFSNLPMSVGIDELNAKMNEVGELSFGEMTGQGRAIVRFRDARDAERCLKIFNRSKVDGQIIDVKHF